MARIRTIKPEFQNSQSMGRVSRDARLTFIELWPQCDDAGRIRANSRMLASVLFPYDEDAVKLIDGWLAELEAEGCITRYKVEKDEYLAINHWDHQRIDHPQPSKLPPPPGKKRTKTTLSVREQSEKPRETDKNVLPLSRTVSRTVPLPESEAAEVREAKPKATVEIATSATARVCAALGVVLTEDTRRLNWPAQVGDMLDSGLDLETDILPACGEAKKRAITNLQWMRKRAESEKATRGVSTNAQNAFEDGTDADWGERLKAYLNNPDFPPDIRWPAKWGKPFERVPPKVLEKFQSRLNANGSGKNAS